MTLHLQFVSLDRPGSEQEDAQSFASRLDRVAGVLKKAAVPKFDLLGVAGAYAPISGLFPLPEEKKIPAAGGSMFPVEALAKMLGDRPNEIFYHLSSEQGILARSGRVEVIGEWAYRNLGPYLPGALRRCAVGGRLKLLGEGDAVLPFYSVRVSPKTSNAALRQAQVMGLIVMAKESWKEGDLTPVVVGDFGFERDSKTLWEMMSTDFDEITVVNGQGGTEHVWIGRESAFRHSKGTLIVSKVSRVPQLNDGGASLTSHAGIAVECEVRSWRSKRSFNASPRARSRGGPALVATERSMHLAWSARQTSGQVHVSRTEDGVAWAEPVAVDGHTNVAPSLCVLGGKVIVAWTEPDGKVAIAASTDDGASFGARKIVDGATSADGPALFTDGDKVRLFFTDQASGKIVQMKSADGASFSGRSELPFTSKHSPAVTRFRGKVWLAWTEADKTSSVSVVTSDDGDHWDASKTSFATHPRRHSSKAPALLAHGDRLTLGWIGQRDANGYAWFAGMYPQLLDEYYRDYFREFVQWTSTSDGSNWTMERALDERSEHTPALADFGARVYLGWTGIDSANLVNVKISAENAI
ncbi:MAG: sialidase family protein [Polyangiaceae bacterium]